MTKCVHEKTVCIYKRKMTRSLSVFLNQIVLRNSGECSIKIEDRQEIPDLKRGNDRNPIEM